jgi:outer membrane autotransporter protein
MIMIDTAVTMARHAACGRAQAFRRAMIASSSFMALVVLGAVGANASQECGTPPVSGIVNCTGTAYPNGIEYNSFDNLTINIGEPAGQTSAVMFDNGYILQATNSADGTAFQKLAIGRNVSLTTGRIGVWQGAYSRNYQSSASSIAEIDTTGVITINASLAAIGIVVKADASAASHANRPDLSAYSRAAARNVGVIVTSGDNATALNVSAASGEIRYDSDVLNMTSLADAANEGIIITSGANSLGISITAATAMTDNGQTNAFNDFVSGSADLAAITVTNTGRIQTSGDSASAVFGRADAAGYAETVTAKATFNGSGGIETFAPNATGIELRSLARGLGPGSTWLAGQTQFTNTGLITTHGNNAIGMLVDAGAAGVVSAVIDAGASVAVTNSGAIVTSGDSSKGIMVMGGAYALFGGRAHGATTITNSGAITTSGRGATGLFANLIDGTETADTGGSIISANNAGAISTTGYSADGVNMWTLTLTRGGAALADLDFTNSGAITVAGAEAAGILASSTSKSSGGGGAQLDAGVWVTNSGAITLTGSTDQEGSSGISVTARTGGDVSRAIASANATNSGAIVVNGLRAAGINASAIAKDEVSAGPVTPSVEAYAKIINTASVTVNGSNAAGLWGQSDTVFNDTGKFLVTGTQATSGVTITNQGNVAANGKWASAILAEAKAEETSVVPAALATKITITNSGTAQTSGANSVAVKAQIDTVLGSTDTISITNAGSIIAGGDGASGIAAIISDNDPPAPSDPSQSVFISNSGSIEVSGDGGNGVFAYAHSITIENLAGSVITGGSSLFAAGVNVSGAAVVVSNGGRIGASGDGALNLTGSTSIAIENKTGGTITGYLVANSPSFTFTNNGIWIARGGDSSFDGASSTVVNRGTVLVVGGQVLKGLSSFQNWGLVSLSSSNTAPGSRAQYEEFILTGDFVGNTGSIVEIGSDMTSRADHLEIAGRISGTTTIKVDPLGSPGLTSGDGILVVDATLGTTSAANFRLDGNTAADTLVDGGYEYALNLVAGSSGHGAWYLSSRVYPGVAQFGQLSSSSLLISELANGALPGLLQQDWDARQAAGPRLASNDPTFVPSAPVPIGRPGFWGGYEFAHMAVTPGGTSDYKMDVSIGHVRGAAAFDGRGRTLIFGLEFSPVDASVDFDKFGSTHIDTDGSAVSGSVLWIEGPWRVGVKYSYDRLRAHFTDDYLGTDARIRLNGYGLQIGGAYAGHFDEATFFEPWATLSYADVGKAAFVDGAGDDVQLGGTHSTLTRLGTKIGRTFDLNDVVLKPYAEFAVDYRFGAKTNVTVGNYTTASTLDGVSVRGGGGVNARINESLSLFGDFVYFGGGKQNGWQGSVGLRLTP